VKGKSRTFWLLMVVCSFSVVGVIFVSFMELPEKNRGRLEPEKVRGQIDSNRAESGADIPEAYVEYLPVFFDTTSLSWDHAYKVDREVMSEAHVEKVKFVLDYHELAYKDEDGKLMIEMALWEDKDLMMNITEKARNWDWLSVAAGYEGDMEGAIPLAPGQTGFKELMERSNKRAEAIRLKFAGEAAQER
jgi:hypothetical protein